MYANLLNYLLQAHVAFLILYACYAWCSRGNTAFALRRGILLALPLVAALLPALAALLPEAPRPAAGLGVVALPTVVTGRDAADAATDASRLVLAAYALPAFCLLLRTAGLTFLLLRHLRRLPRRRIGDFTVRLLPAGHRAHSPSSASSAFRPTPSMPALPTSACSTNGHTRAAGTRLTSCGPKPSARWAGAIRQHGSGAASCAWYMSSWPTAPPAGKAPTATNTSSFSSATPMQQLQLFSISSTFHLLKPESA